MEHTIIDSFILFALKVLYMISQATTKSVDDQIREMENRESTAFMANDYDTLSKI
jgi:hypothetical protein